MSVSVLLQALWLLQATAPAADSELSLPRGAEPAPLEFSHFPSRLHAFVWRNWGLLPDDRLAQVVRAPVEDLRRVATSLGLPHRTTPNPDMERRGYLSLIRRNWHLLPYEQILTLLDWKEEKLAFTLREDDFFWIKLGRLKPRCEPLLYAAPSKEERQAAAALRTLVISEFGKEWHQLPEPRFSFVRELSTPAGAAEPLQPRARDEGALTPRFLYSYFALYGDPLLEPDLDPFPDGYLARLARNGVDGVWLQTVLRRLCESPLFPLEGQDAGKRLAALANLVNRADRHGIGIFLYLNEPRAMPLEFFQKHPGLGGTRKHDVAAMCTSTPAVREFLRDGVASVFKAVPKLRGVFTITMSENLTSCYSHGNGAGCTRCSKRRGPEVVAEVNRWIAEGAWMGNPDAEVVVWDWGWPTQWTEAIVKRLPSKVRLQSVSEWSLPIQRGGVGVTVGEYAMSVVGPGPRALQHWRIASSAGLRFGAKVQLNNTWELSTVPYIPVLDLVAEHLRLRREGTSSLMLSWTLGGYPSPNLELARAFYGASVPTPQVALRELAERRYGKEAGRALRAWTAFSEAFSEYPLHIEVLYRGPQQLGPANLLHTKPTGFKATMVGFPYDDLDGWRGVYPAAVFVEQFEKLAKRWTAGAEELRQAADKVDAALRPAAFRDLSVAQACGEHFTSVANQARFVLARARFLGAPNESTREDAVGQLRQVITAESACARRLFDLARRDSRLGYEASNQYVYLPRDLVEKLINCRHSLKTLR